MTRKKSIVWYGVSYQELDVAEVVHETKGAMCPYCNEGNLIEIAPNLVQYGLFEDVYFEFTECEICKFKVMIRSKIVLEGGIPFETMLDEYIKSQPDYIPL